MDMADPINILAVDQWSANYGLAATCASEILYCGPPTATRSQRNLLAVKVTFFTELADFKPTLIELGLCKGYVSTHGISCV